MNKIHIIIILFFWCSTGMANSHQIPAITLQQFSQMLGNKSCIEFSELLKTKYNIIAGPIEYMHREKFKGNCLQWNIINTGLTLNFKEKIISQSIKVISTNFLGDFQFYLFKKYKRKYLYVGKIAISTRYIVPEIDIYNFPNGTVYSTETVSGGTGERDATWVFYSHVKNKDPQEFFSIDNNGYSSHYIAPFNREYESKIDKSLVKKNQLRFDYRISYSIYSSKKGDIYLFSVKKSLLLDYGNNLFSLSRKSPNSFEEINEIMTHGEKYFCQNYKSQLNKLLKSKEKSIIQWSKKMFNLCKAKNRKKKPLYTIQVAAFKATPNIVKYIHKIRKYWSKNEIQIWRGGGKNNYLIVSIGLFNSLKKANSYKFELIKKHKDMNFLVKLYQ